MYNAEQIALWFLYKNNAEIKEHIVEDEEYEVYEEISHLKLQKLLYFAQGVFLSLNNNKLFQEKIIAWEHGPVVQEVYSIYKENKRNPIEFVPNEMNDKIISNIETNQEVSYVLNLVYDNFAIYTAWQLRDMTHEAGGPWDVTVKRTGYNSEIQTDLIKAYFDRNVVEA